MCEDAQAILTTHFSSMSMRDANLEGRVLFSPFLKPAAPSRVLDSIPIFLPGKYFRSELASSRIKLSDKVSAASPLYRGGSPSGHHRTGRFGLPKTGVAIFSACRPGLCYTLAFSAIPYSAATRFRPFVFFPTGGLQLRASHRFITVLKRLLTGSRDRGIQIILCPAQIDFFSSFFWC